MMLTTLLAAALLSAPQGRTSMPAPSDQTPAATAEGVEILRRVLIDALDKALAPDDRRERQQVLFDQHNGPDAVVARLWAGGQSVQHARAFHMPGAGLFFALDVSLPIVQKPREPAGSDQPESDEWERARRELRGSSESNPLALRRFYASGESVGELDPAAIERTTDTVLRTLARHLARIEGLGGNETVTVALRLSGRDRSWLHEWTTDEPFGTKRLEPDGEGEEPKRAESMAFSALVLATGNEVREQSLVLQISVADLQRASATPEDLRRVARINRY